jgi:anti-anti-sigma factor
MKLSLLPLQNDALIRVRCEGVVSLRGLDPNAEPLRDLLGGNCYSHKLLLNLEKTQGIDTSGLSWLCRASRLIQRANGAFVLYAIPPVVARVFDFVRVGDTLPVASSESAAEEMIRGTQAEKPVELPEPPRDGEPNPIRLSG